MLIYYIFILSLLAEYILSGISYSYLLKKRKVRFYATAWIPLIGTWWTLGRLSDNISKDYLQKKKLSILILIFQLVLIIFGAAFIVQSFTAPEIKDLLASTQPIDTASISNMITNLSPNNATIFYINTIFVAFSYIGCLVLKLLALFNVFREYAPKFAMSYMLIIFVSSFFSIITMGFIASILVFMIRKNPSQFEILNKKSAYNQGDNQIFKNF